MEELRLKRFAAFIAIAFMVGCASTLKFDKPEQLAANDEFEKSVKIEKPPTPPEAQDEEEAAEKPEATPATAVTPTPTPSPTPVPKVAKKVEVKKPAAKSGKKSGASTSGRRQPDIEDEAGFDGRRPTKDPFRVGEVITHDVHHFLVSAGAIKFKTEPFAQVDGRKSYVFATELKTYPTFSKLVYSVNDRVETLVDYETLVPRVFQLHVKESGQLREARMLFNEQTNRATYWEKKVTEKKGVQEKKQDWEILPYSQNVFSAIFYMRVFQWDLGKDYAFRVADDEENIVFRGKAVAKEKLDTEIGEMMATKIKVEFTVKGAFKPVGDIYFWLSDDEHKYPLRIECKIKIGTLISEIIALKPGQN